MDPVAIQAEGIQYISKLRCPFVKTKSQQNDNKSKQNKKNSKSFGFFVILFCLFSKNGHLSFDMYCKFLLMLSYLVVL